MDESLWSRNAFLKQVKAEGWRKQKSSGLSKACSHGCSRPLSSNLEVPTPHSHRVLSHHPRSPSPFPRFDEPVPPFRADPQRSS